MLCWLGSPRVTGPVLPAQSLGRLVLWPPRCLSHPDHAGSTGICCCSVIITHDAAGPCWCRLYQVQPGCIQCSYCACTQNNLHESNSRRMKRRLLRLLASYVMWFGKYCALSPCECGCGGMVNLCMHKLCVCITYDRRPHGLFFGLPNCTTSQTVVTVGTNQALRLYGDMLSAPMLKSTLSWSTLCVAVVIHTCVVHSTSVGLL
jgi:hypothetical protein